MGSLCVKYLKYYKLEVLFLCVCSKALKHLLLPSTRHFDILMMCYPLTTVTFTLILICKLTISKWVWNKRYQRFWDIFNILLEKDVYNNQTRKLWDKRDDLKFSNVTFSSIAISHHHLLIGFKFLSLFVMQGHALHSCTNYSYLFFKRGELQTNTLLKQEYNGPRQKVTQVL